MTEPRDVETKLARARTQLILDKPFLGALVLRLPMVEADPKWCRTTATDARSFYYNHEYIDALSPAQTRFVLAHEALHCALSHFARRQHRVKHRWDVACDHAVNPLLVKEGLVPPPGTLLVDSFDDMTAEEIYPYIDENTADRPMDQHVYDEDDQQQSDSGEQRSGEDPDRDRDEDRPGDQPGEEPSEGSEAEGNRQPAAQDDSAGGAPQPPPLDATEQDALDTQWQQRLAGAAQTAMQAGKMSGALARMVEHLLQPQLPWRMLLARYLSAAARDDYSFLRPSRREASYILPSLRSSQINLVVALDTSGSVSDSEIGEFIAEVNAIKGQLRARITLLACDESVDPDGPWIYEPWEDFSLPKELAGGGGTRFVPVFDWLDAVGSQPDVLVYFTDAEGEFPSQEPNYPVIWLVKGKSKTPWGTRVQLN
jgi:predicted metal-dependent peptidase